MTVVHRGSVQGRVGLHHPLGYRVSVGVYELSEIHLFPPWCKNGLPPNVARPRRFLPRNRRGLVDAAHPIGAVGIVLSIQRGGFAAFLLMAASHPPLM